MTGALKGKTDIDHIPCSTLCLQLMIGLWEYTRPYLYQDFLMPTIQILALLY